MDRQMRSLRGGWRLALAALPLVLVAAVALLGLPASGPGTTHALEGAVVVDCDASTQAIDSSCTYQAGDIFDIRIDATAVPAGDIFGFQVKPTWIDNILQYLPDANPGNEALYPNCTIPARSDNQLTEPSVLFSCTTFPAAIPASPGPLVQLEMQCESGAGGVTPLTLVAREGDPQGGTSFTDAFTNPIDPSLTHATVNCIGPTPTPTNTPPPATFTPTPTATPEATPTETPLPSEQQDVTISKSDSPDPVEGQGVITYRLLVQNIGVLPAAGVAVSDELPAGASFRTASAGCSHDSGVVTCDLGELAANDSGPGGEDEVVIEIEVTAPQPDEDTRITNHAEVSAANEPFANTGNNQDEEETVVLAPRADLTVILSDDPDPVLSGDPMSYTLTVRNLGPRDAENVTVEHTLPAGAQFVTSDVPCSGPITDVLTCDLGNLGSQGETTAQVEVLAPEVSQDVAVKSLAFVSADNELFSETGNNLAVQSTAVIAPDPDLAIAVSDSADPVLRTRFYSYELVVTNPGPGDAKDVLVTSILPAALQSNGSRVTFVDATGAVCQEGALASSQASGDGPSQGGVVLCLIPFVAGGGGQVVVTLNVRAPSVLVDTVVTVEVNVVDPDEPADPQGNNSASESTLIDSCRDVDGEGGVSAADIALVVLGFGLTSADPEYDLLLDFDGKGAISAADIAFVVVQFGSECGT